MEQEDPFEKAKILVKQISALGIFQAGLPFKLDVSVTLEDTGWALWQKRRTEAESAPRILEPSLEVGRSPIAHNSP